jgi:LPS-assembly protein
MSHYQKAPWNIDAKLDLDLVSDQDYLREFPTGYMGFEDTQDYFNERFGREMDDVNDPVRLNRLNLNRIWPSWSLNAEARYFWDSTQRNSEKNDTTISRLPVVDFQGSKQKLRTSPLYFDLDSNYNYFWRPSGPRAQRVDAHPRVYWPYRFQNYFTFEPSAGIRQTLYYLDDIEANDEYNRTKNRTMYDIRLNFFSDVYRVFNIYGANIQKIRHSIRPRIIYDYIPKVTQGDVPRFDSLDRIEHENKFTYSLTHTFTSKLLKGGQTRLADRNEVSRGSAIRDPGSYSYKDFLRFRMGQEWFLNRSNRTLSPLVGELDLFPGKYISIDADTAWSVYGDGFVTHNIGAKVWDKRGDRFFVDYRYDENVDQEGEDKQNIESIFMEARLQVTNRLSVFGDYERNLEENLHIRTSAGFFYNAQCWSFRFNYVDEPEDTKFEFKIDLHGLGGFGL